MKTHIIHLEYLGKHFSIVVSETRLKKAFKSEDAMNTFMEECIAKVMKLHSASPYGIICM